MKILITQKVKDSINGLGNKTAKTNGLKLYSELFYLNNRARPNGYFDAPSLLLKKINSRYNTIIDKFINDGIIKYQENLHQNKEDLFGPSKITKNYSTKHGYCMKYKFLIDFTAPDVEEIEVDITSTKDEKWFVKIKNTLNILGFDDTISRDSFGRRVHYNTLYNYKTLLKGKDLYVIDAVCSQPRLLWILLKEKEGLDPKFKMDDNYNDIFENNKDFYLYLVTKLELKTDKEKTARDKAKDIFMFWINSSGYVPDYKINLIFPKTSRFLSMIKSRHYKDSASLLQRKEAKIWIDDILTNCPTNFALTVHDSIIVKAEDAENIKYWIQERYPLLKISEPKEL